MGTILVERLHEGGGWKAVTNANGDDLPAIEFDTTAKAERWIQDYGEDGETYRITREVMVVTVKTETVRKTVLQKM